MFQSLKKTELEPPYGHIDYVLCARLTPSLDQLIEKRSQSGPLLLSMDSETTF